MLFNLSVDLVAILQETIPVARIVNELIEESNDNERHNAAHNYDNVAFLDCVDADRPRQNDKVEGGDQNIVRVKGLIHKEKSRFAPNVLHLSQERPLAEEKKLEGHNQQNAYESDPIVWNFDSFECDRHQKDRIWFEYVGEDHRGHQTNRDD